MKILNGNNNGSTDSENSGNENNNVTTGNVNTESSNSNNIINNGNSKNNNIDNLAHGKLPNAGKSLEEYAIIGIAIFLVIIIIVSVIKQKRRK